MNGGQGGLKGRLVLLGQHRYFFQQKPEIFPSPNTRLTLYKAFKHKITNTKK